MVPVISPLFLLLSIANMSDKKQDSHYKVTIVTTPLHEQCKAKQITVTRTSMTLTKDKYHLQ